MKLYLHIGTEKTGSSYLQTLLANNREQLKRSGFYFPSAGKSDVQMIKGRISAGNGQNLFDSLIQNDKSASFKILKRHIEIAILRKSHTILISNELLALAFAEKLIWDSFAKIVEELRFTELRLLMFLRNPVDQALSLYKHRAKSGTVPEIEEWINENYNYHNSLCGLMNRIENDGLLCTFRQYRKEADYMEQALFKDWLEIEKPTVIVNKSVNPSLSISELLFLKKLKIHHNELAQEFYNQMLKLPQKEKAVEYQMEKYYRQIIERYLAQFGTVWQKCNERLPEGEKLILPVNKKGSTNLDTPDKILSFSDAQASLITKIMAEALTPSMKWKLLMRAWRNDLGKMKVNFFKRIKSI